MQGCKQARQQQCTTSLPKEALAAQGNWLQMLPADLDASVAAQKSCCC
jgi:hypothetical protein